MAITAYLYDKIYLEHDSGFGHPERAERLTAINEKLKSQEYYDSLIKIHPSIPDYRHIEAIHSKHYIARVQKEIESGERYLDSMDTVVCRKSFEVALMAVGGSLNMCDAVMTGKASAGFCAVRPPGHHAEHDYAAGFCIFNNIAISAKYLQSVHSLKKIAIVDWDVHHGNGTQHSFEKDRNILYISLHQYPHYPGTGASHEQGAGDGKGFTLNMPMGAGSGDDQYLDAFRSRIVPELNRFSPEIVLVSAGFDAHKSDPLSSIRLTTASFHQFTKMLHDIAKTHSKGRIIAFLEGGYNLSSLAESVETVVREFVEG